MAECIRVAIVAAHDIVESGLRAILAHVRDIEVVPTPSGPGGANDADVVLYDALALAADGKDFRTQVNGGPPVIVLARDLRPDLASRALADGAVGSVSIDADAAAVVAEIRSVAGTGYGTASEPHQLGWETDLTLREVQVLSAIARGLSNHEIADLLLISPNTLKSYIRHAYRKIGVGSRSQAVGWCLRHGFASTTPGDTR